MMLSLSVRHSMYLIDYLNSAVKAIGSLKRLRTGARASPCAKTRRHHAIASPGPLWYNVFEAFAVGNAFAVVFVLSFNPTKPFKLRHAQCF
jgi:hypothetical protein